MRCSPRSGPGRLESFVSDDEDDLTWLEAQSATRPAMRQALSNVWCALDVSTATLIRLDEAAGAPLTRPRPREEWPAEVLAVEEAEAALVQLAGPQWWLLDDLTAEQSLALAAHRTAEEALLDRLRWTEDDGANDHDLSNQVDARCGVGRSTGRRVFRGRIR